MIGIYKITNIVNGKCYIGQSDNIDRRWREHKNKAFQANGRYYKHPLYCAIRKYSLSNFTFEVLEECSKDELDEKEIKYIAQYKAYEQGYNLTEGGSRSITSGKLSKEDVVQIKNRLKTTVDNMFVIAKDFHVHWTTIRTINTGISHYDPNEKYPLREYIYTSKSGVTKLCSDLRAEYRCRICGNETSEKGGICIACSRIHSRVVEQRPSKLDLAQQICETSFEAVGAKYGVSGKAIAKWCQSYKIPHTREALKQWYCAQLNIEYIPPIKHTQAPKLKRQVKQIDSKTGEVLHIFPDMSSAKKTLNVTDSHISAVCLGKRKTAHGYKWEYL